MIRCAIMLMLMCGAGSAWAAPNPALTLLTAVDVPTLVAPPPRGERIIALWALDCVYCEANLAALARVQRANPDDIELVLVAIDGPSARTDVATRLRKMHMQAVPARLYAEAVPQRLNYLIDPTWGGETPRTLVIRADGSRIAFSGQLTVDQIRRIAPK